MFERAPLAEVARGLAAGAVGTAVMTAGQLAYYKLADVEPSDTPAQVAKRVIEGVLDRGPVRDDQMPILNNAMHIGYGIGWGGLYGLAGRGGVRSGLLFGVVVWGASLVQLPAMRLSPPLWELDPEAIAPDLGFHLLYGVAVGAAFRP